MHMKILRTENDYEAALTRVEVLMSAAPGTDEFDELEVLSLLVERYEEKHHPVALPNPVEAILFRMEQAGLRQRDLIPYIGSSSKVSEVLSGKRSLTLTMMKSLHKELGIPAEVFLTEADKRSPLPHVDAARLPWSEMVKRGWLPDFSGTAREAKANAAVLLPRIFHPAASKCLEPALYRRSIRGNSTMDEYAVTAWTARIVSIACRQDDLATYLPGAIDAQFMSGLIQLSFLDEGPKLAQEYLKKHGIHLVVERHLPKTRIDGAASILPDGRPVIGLSLRYDRLDNFWFCLAHELAHVALHFGEDDLWFVDDLQSEGGDREKEADAWANEALIPPEVWRSAGNLDSEASVKELAQRLSISPAIIAGRLRFESGNFRLMSDLIGQGQVRHHFIH